MFRSPVPADAGTETCWGGSGAGCLLVLGLEVALGACLLEGPPRCTSLERDAADAPPLSRVAGSGACRRLQVWGISCCRWREQDLPSALRCFDTSANHTVLEPHRAAAVRCVLRRQ